MILDQMKGSSFLGPTVGPSYAERYYIVLVEFNEGEPTLKLSG